MPKFPLLHIFTPQTTTTAKVRIIKESEKNEEVVRTAHHAHHIKCVGVLVTSHLVIKS